MDSTKLNTSLITDYFLPVKEGKSNQSSPIKVLDLFVKKEKEVELGQKIVSGWDDGLEIVVIENKGRGVIATKMFNRGDFVIEYAGDLIDMTEAIQRHSKYTKDPMKGCYMYLISKIKTIDSTEESRKLGHLLNHSKANGNCHTKLIDIKDHPYLVLLASQDISKGEELMYDYGDRSKQALASHPWLKT